MKQAIILFCTVFISLTSYSQSAVHALPEYTYVQQAADKYSWERVVHSKAGTIMHNTVACTDSIVFSFGGFEEGNPCPPIRREMRHIIGRRLAKDTLHYPGRGFSSNVFFIQDSLLYLGGGRDSCMTTYSWNDFWQFNLNTQHWKRLADLPFYYKFPPYVFREGNRVLVVVPRLEGENFRHVNTLAYEYDMSHDSWSVISKPLPPVANILPKGCADQEESLRPAAFYLDHQIYILFQIGVHAPNQWGCSNAFYKCNTTSGEWTKLPSFPGYLENDAFSISDGVYGYVGGGFAYSRAQRREVYRYDPELARWERITDLPEGFAYGVGWNFKGETYVGFGLAEREHSVSVWRMKYDRRKLGKGQKAGP